MGALDADGIRFALEISNVPKRKWEEYTDKITVFITTAMSANRGE